MPPGPHGVGVSGTEPGDVGGFTNQLAGGQRTAARNGQQGGNQHGDPTGDVSFELVRFPSEFPDPGDLPPGQISNHAAVAVEELVDGGEGLITVQRPRWRVVSGFEFVETPPQPVLSGGTVLDQGLL